MPAAAWRYTCAAFAVFFTLYSVYGTESAAYDPRCDVASYAGTVRELHLASCGASLRGLELLGRFPLVETLDLTDNSLAEVPEGALRGLPSLRVLLLGRNRRLEALPDVSALRSLSFLGLRACGLRGHVDAAGRLPSGLDALVLTDNRIESLTGLRTAAPRLRKLMLSHNALAAWPALPGSLELLRLASNPALAAPTPLAPHLQALPRLGWLACAGTPVAGVAAGAVVVPEAGRDELSAGDGGLLGKGASGRVVRAAFRGEAVAVKGFPGLSSDGVVSDELAALRRLQHEYIVAARAVLRAPPGVVMELLPGARPFGLPPSFETVVRDRAPSEAVDEATVAAVCLAAAQALAHVHMMGFAHGDVYAHNVLLGGGGDSGPLVAKLSDFGAAWPVRPEDRAAVEAVEVCGFGALLEDAAEWCGGRCSAGVRKGLRFVAQQCRSAEVDERPTFDAAYEALVERLPPPAGRRR
eukprot:Rhum_TRINITY_DN22878_c0_g1::Rhum_TRINITY_DN22878_c0_g1_i1::g.176167::m.176167